MFVKAKVLIFYGNKRRRPFNPDTGKAADIFKLSPRKGIDAKGNPVTDTVENQFDPASMEKIEVSRVAEVDQREAQEEAEREKLAKLEQEDAEELAVIQAAQGEEKLEYVGNEDEPTILEPETNGSENTGDIEVLG